MRFVRLGLDDEYKEQFTQMTIYLPIHKRGIRIWHISLIILPPHMRFRRVGIYLP